MKKIDILPVDDPSSPNDLEGIAQSAGRDGIETYREKSLVWKNKILRIPKICSGLLLRNTYFSDIGRSLLVPRLCRDDMQS